jgi:carboxyl-terminal processing protease
VDNGKFGLTAGEDAIKLTIAKYLTPSGRSINGIGIEPDVKIELPEGAEKDVQLDKAIEIIKTKM